MCNNVRPCARLAPLVAAAALGGVEPVPTLGGCARRNADAAPARGAQGEETAGLGHKYKGNSISTTKYNVATFLPKVRRERWTARRVGRAEPLRLRCRWAGVV